MRSIISFLITGLLGASALAGVMNGGGGKGVVCRDSQNQIKSVELLDLWEARTLFGEQPMQVGNDIETEVKSALERLKYGYPEFSYHQDEEAPGGFCHREECNLLEMLRELPIFFRNDPNVVRLHGVTLELTDDSYELARPVDCQIEQIVNYQNSGKIYINQDLWDRLDNLNKVSLITHEIFYSLLRSYAQEKNSVRTRRAIGYVMSGHSFTQSNPDFPNKNYLECTDQTFQKWTAFDIAYDPKRGLLIYPEIIMGSRSIGVPDPVYLGPGWSDIVKNSLQGTCNPMDSFAIPFHMDGPIEFDHFFNFIYTCDNGKTKIAVSEQRVGMPETEQIPLTCMYRAKKK
jgi:hypothetical protein